MDAPKTRTEKKGRDKDKQKGATPYSAKHVRQQEKLTQARAKSLSKSSNQDKMIKK
jgi:hypothetical protein